MVPEWAPHVQTVFLLIGLFWALRKGWEQAERLFPENPGQALRAFAPVAVLLAGIVSLFLWLYTG